MRVAIIGSREFGDADLIDRCIRRLVDKHGDALVLVSRGMRGTGKLVAAAAQKLGRTPEIFPVSWDEGDVRRTEESKNQNRALVRSIDQLVVIWDAKADTRGRDVLHAVKCALEFMKGVFLYDVQKQAWVTERPDLWARTNAEHPLIPWYVRESRLNRYRGY